MAKRILIADDDRAIADLLTTALDQEGYDTAKTTESLRFFDAVREHKPDLILLDLLMPYLNGRDELRIINMNEDTSHIPVIIVTADIDAKREENELRQWGVVTVVTKPFDLEVLVKLIKDTIGEPQGVAR
jgi:DNA-binding response OmpR family regulator